MAMFLQALAATCGLATNRDLAQACRDSYPLPLVRVLWIVIELAIVATDLAEVIGAAVAMKLLFGLPEVYGVFVTSLDVFIFLFISGKKFRVVEGIVGVLVLLITACFAVEVALSKPQATPLFWGFVPSSEIFVNKKELLIGIGIIGATVMPHNLFLHSSIVLTRNTRRTKAAIADAIRYSIFDSTVHLSVAWFVNCAILMMAAAVFHRRGYTDIATLEDASGLLSPLLGNKAASVLFGVALLASGQNATLTGTLTGQIVMEGFLKMTLNPTFRRVFTRLLAIIPAVLAAVIGGPNAFNSLLINSQVVLSFALPFAVFPLLHITASKERMRGFQNSTVVNVIAMVIGLLILLMNILLFLPL